MHELYTRVMAMLTYTRIYVTIQKRSDFYAVQ